MEATRSYTIWFSQRTGSTWLAGLLEATGAAGRPREHLNFGDTGELYSHYGTRDSADLVSLVRAQGTDSSGTFGLKHSFHQPSFDSLLRALVPHWQGEFGEAGRLAAWEHAFPHHRHIFLTRRNKVRLAVSWWRAIKSAEWHRQADARPADADLREAYSFGAIDRLVQEATMREAGISELLTDAGLVPLTITYEDLVLAPEESFASTLAYLDLATVELPTAGLSPIADDVSEEWVQRYREEKQSDWTNHGW